MFSATGRYSKIIKDEAKRLGFMFCGISKAEFLEEEAPRLESWLNKNYNGKMGYMENHFDKRLDPTKLVEGSSCLEALMHKSLYSCVTPRGFELTIWQRVLV